MGPEMENTDCGHRTPEQPISVILSFSMEMFKHVVHH